MVITSAFSPDKRVQATPANSAKKRRPHRAALLCALLLLSGLAYCWLVPWPETVRREAYLPELESQSKDALSDGRLQALVGARQIEAGDYGAAAQSLRQALAAGEAGPSVWLNLAAALDANGERPRAVANLRLALKNDPQNAELKAAAERVSQVPPGAQVGGLAPALAPDGPRPIVEQLTQGSFLNGVSSWWGHNHPDASGFTTRQLWAQTQPKDALAQRLWGLALLRNRRPREAQTPLIQAVALAPQSVEAHLALAGWQEQDGKNAAAALEYIATLRLKRDIPDALLGLGRASLASGHVGHAARAFRRASEVAPNALEAWTGLGRAIQLTGVGYDQSAAAYAKAAQLAPKDTSFFNDYSISLDKIARQSEVETLLRARVAAAPTDALAHHLLGRVLMNLNPTPARIAEAEAQTRAALKLQPGNPLSGIQLAQLLFQQNKAPNEAIKLLKSAIERDPFNRNSLLLLARVYSRSGQDDLADAMSAQAAKLFDNQQKLTALKDQERNSVLSRPEREQMAKLYQLTGGASNARRQRTILELTATDSQKVKRAEDQYNADIDQVLGPAQTALEKE